MYIWHYISGGHRRRPHLRAVQLLILLSPGVAGCTSTPVTTLQGAAGKTVCDSYIIFEMCVQDLVGDGSVDLIFFAESRKIFMYRQGMRNTVAQVMPVHRCAVPLDATMQATTNRVLQRENPGLREELGIKRYLLASYLAAKPEIDACNARFEAQHAEQYVQEKAFFMDASGWDDDPGY